MFENLSQEQFEQIIEVLILYKQINNKKKVTLSESSVKEAFHFMNNEGKKYASQIGKDN